MKRDMDLIRKILLCIEGEDRLFQVSTAFTVQVGDYAKPIVDYHVRLLADGGYLMGVTSAPNSVPLVQGLTWKGHDFVDTMRPKGVWVRILGETKKLGSMTLDLALELAKDLVKEKARTHLGIH